MPGQSSHLTPRLIIPEAKFEVFLPVQYSEGFFVAKLTHSVSAMTPPNTASSPPALAPTPFSQGAR